MIHVESWRPVWGFVVISSSKSRSTPNKYEICVSICTINTGGELVLESDINFELTFIQLTANFGRPCISDWSKLYLCPLTSKLTQMTLCSLFSLHIIWFRLIWCRHQPIPPVFCFDEKKEWPLHTSSNVHWNRVGHEHSRRTHLNHPRCLSLTWPPAPAPPPPHSKHCKMKVTFHFALLEPAAKDRLADSASGVD